MSDNKMRAPEPPSKPYRRLSPKPPSAALSLPFSFQSTSNNSLKPKPKFSLNLSADRRPPQIDTQLASPKEQSALIVTPTESLQKEPIGVRPHTTKYSEKHFEIPKRHIRNWENTKLPVTPIIVIKHFAHRIPDWEKEEIIKYTNIYFIGNSAKPADPVFDDEEGFYNIFINDHIYFRYEIIQLLGKGSFGQVVEVYDHATKKPLAMKIIRNQKDFYEQALVEIEILKVLKENDRDYLSNIVHCEENFIFRNHIVNPI
jgi:hypothetical protein